MLLSSSNRVKIGKSSFCLLWWDLIFHSSSFHGYGRHVPLEPHGYMDNDLLQTLLTMVLVPSSTPCTVMKERSSKSSKFSKTSRSKAAFGTIPLFPPAPFPAYPLGSWFNFLGSPLIFYFYLSLTAVVPFLFYPAFYSFSERVIHVI